MIDEHNAGKDTGLTTAHIRNMVEKCGVIKNDLVDIFVEAFGGGVGTGELKRKCAEIFVENIGESRYGGFMNWNRLIQFQCGREGTLFYYQTGVISPFFVEWCPVCGSKRVTQTGRIFPPVDENAPLVKTKTKSL